MNPSSPLSRKQLEYFKTHGFLILKNLIDELSVNQWREQIWRELDSSFDRPESWPRHRSGLDGYQYDPPESAFGRHPALAPIIQQLGGGNFSTTGGGAPIIRWPEPEKSWQMPQSGHIDAYGGNWSPFMIGATTYLYDVQPKGGAFIFWPDSHYVAHRYFKKNPTKVDGSFMKEEGFSWDIFCHNPKLGGQEFIASPGDVVLWHSYLTHNGSTNVNSSPRIALFARWPHYQQRQPNDFRYDIPEDLWEHWAI